MKAHNENHASENGSFSNVAMNGSEVFKFAVRAVPAVSRYQARILWAQKADLSSDQRQGIDILDES